MNDFSSNAVTQREADGNNEEPEGLAKNENNKEKSCGACGQKFKYTKRLKMHEFMHEGEAELWCKHCVQYFPSKEDKEIHIVEQHVRKKKHKCKICLDAVFYSEDEYFVHINDVHKGQFDNFYMCSDCGKQFKTRGELTHHNKSKCGTVKQYPCKVCDQKLMNAGSLHNHMLRHTVKCSNMCGYCGKMFLTSGQLRVHERTHTQEKLFVCDVCGKGFCHRQSLITHSSIHTGIKPYECENCGNSFSCVGNLMKHRKTHADTCGVIPLTTHRVNNPSTKMKVRINTPSTSKLRTVKKEKETKDKLIACKNKLLKKTDDTIIDLEEKPNLTELSEETLPQTDLEIESFTDCSSSSESPEVKSTDDSVLDDMVEEAEDRVDDNFSNVECFKCSCCKMDFPTKEECKEHKQRMHLDILRCQDCDKVFSNKDSLRSHCNLFHKGIPKKVYTYVCEKCGVQFKQKAFLNYHKNSNCGSGPIYECHVCGKGFHSIHTRSSHLRIHDPKKKFLCKYCGKSFRWNGQLKVHERSHTGEKPFKCLYCPKAFGYRESLLTHSSLHTGIKPHLCRACGSRFSCVGNLIKHRTTHASTCGIWYSKNQ